jgi:aminoglycoside phosphotransferase (APT) family kinase protein
MLDEQIRFDRIRDLKHVPRIVHASDQGSSKPGEYYLILEYIKGCELFDNYKALNERDICDIGTEIADFLIDLHKIKGEKYDIGHYVPIIPGYDKSWRSGHERYWDSIYKGLKDIQLPDSVRNSLELANDYISTNILSLNYETGPSLLHNDFHYKNIIINNNTFSGVIDWECSQYGEADFDLIHLLHWSLFPPIEGFDMTDLFHQIFHLYMKRNRIPMIEKRLTIYLLEHDFIQILWSQGKKADEYVPRISWWLSTRLEQYILKLIG